MLRLSVLGGLRVDGSSGPLRGAATQRRPLALLALLAAAGDRGINRDRLLAYLWPESDIERARGSLKQTLYILRRDLERTTIGLSRNSKSSGTQSFSNPPPKRLLLRS